MKIMEFREKKTLFLGAWNGILPQLKSMISIADLETTFIFILNILTYCFFIIILRLSFNKYKSTDLSIDLDRSMIQLPFGLKVLIYTLVE